MAKSTTADREVWEIGLDGTDSTEYERSVMNENAIPNLTFGFLYP